MQLVEFQEEGGVVAEIAIAHGQAPRCIHRDLANDVDGLRRVGQQTLTQTRELTQAGDQHVRQGPARDGQLALPLALRSLAPSTGYFVPFGESADATITAEYNTERYYAGGLNIRYVPTENVKIGELTGYVVHDPQTLDNPSPAPLRLSLRGRADSAAPELRLLKCRGALPPAAPLPFHPHRKH